MPPLEDDLIRKIKVLNDTIWEQRAKQPYIDRWLDNFLPPAAPPSPNERLHALYLLSNFLYFGGREMRELLKSLFRDKYKYPIVQSIRQAHGNTSDCALIAAEFSKELHRTRFLGVGNPSESGCHLLYYFRQENELPKTLFIHAHQIFLRQATTGLPALRNPDVTRYVFIDDFCGSGHQAKEYSQDLVEDLKRLNPNSHVSYYVLFATEDGMKAIRERTSFDAVDCIYELDATFKCFGPLSRYFPLLRADDPLKDIDKAFAQAMCTKYGQTLCPDKPLGYGGCQLLLGFHHNTPDNTLPILWHAGSSEHPWTPIFKRYDKQYGW